MVCVVPSLMVLLWFSTSLHSSGDTASNPLPPHLPPQIPAPILVSGLCKPKEKVGPTAEELQLSRKDLAAAPPSPLACFVLSGGHHALFCVIVHEHIHNCAG